MPNNDTPVDRRTGVQLDSTLGTIQMPQSAAASLAEYYGSHRKISNAGADLAAHMDSEAQRMAGERARLRKQP